MSIQEYLQKVNQLYKSGISTEHSYRPDLRNLLESLLRGGYQPAQKWLKDRKGRQLSFDDVRHYQKIIVALTETDRIMKEIDKVDFE